MAQADFHTDWRGLYRTGAIAAIVMAVIIPIQGAIYAFYPLPETVTGHLELLQRNWLLGLLSLDLLYLIDTALTLPIYLALYIALRRVSRSAMLIATAVALVGIAVYYASNTAFEMLSLSRQYAAAATEAQHTALLGAGHAMLALYTGTAFNVYYVLSDVALLIIAFVMLRSDVFSKKTGYLALAAGIFMAIPSTVGTIGLVFSLLSLVPWEVWLIFIARRLWQLAQ